MNPGRGTRWVESRPSKHAHWLVRDTAIAMGHELYDHMMHDNVWYDIWKKNNPGKNAKALEKLFVDRNLSLLLPQARAILAGMLQHTADPKLEEQIYEALTLDATLIRGRTQ